MKLELKHLAPYLPYGLKLSYWNNPKDIRELVTIDLYQSVLDTWTQKGTKPILRPLSDFDEIDNDFDLTTDFENAFNYVRGHIVFLLTSDKVYLKDIMTVTEWMFKNRFDVFGLIDAGLAIDINTIQPCT